VTGGQRIDLLGVRKEDLPRVWQDLGMPSGHAYAKALRTVKTCVGSEWCRFGTQDSTQMGKDLERALWRMYAPHKVKLAVSGCPRNCAESGIKDVGIVGVDSGWEIHVAGNGGIHTVAAQLLCKVRTPTRCSSTAAPSCSCTARKAGTWSARCTTSARRPGPREEADPRRRRGPQALWERLQFALDGEPDPWFEFDKARSTCASSTRWSRRHEHDVDTDLPRRGHPGARRAPRRARRPARRRGVPQRDDKVFALLDRCPHKGGPLSQGIVFGESVACPLHNWTIGLADGCAQAPDEAARRASRCTVEQGVVRLDADELERIAVHENA
jgi:nitrite reductase/ring-hydroxylating ferredoxin subunit